MDQLDRLEAGLNALHDLDASWWPFLHLRPAEEQRISAGRALLLASLYGVFAGMLTNVIAAVAGVGGDLPLWLLPIGASVAVFGLLQVVFAVSWNRRAARLAAPPRGFSWGKTPTPADPPEGS